MSHKRIFIFTGILLLALGLAAAWQSAASAAATSTYLGTAGLSYHYVQTFGVTEVPYLADTNHLYGPQGIFIDAADHLYVAEGNGNRVLGYDETGRNVLALGKAGMCWSDTGPSFCGPSDMAIDLGGNLWVVENSQVIQFSPAGAQLQIFPTDRWTTGADNAHFNGAAGIAFNSAGKMFVSDKNNHRVQVFDLSGGSPVYQTTIGVSATSGSDNAHFNQPARIALDGAGSLYVVDQGNGRVQKCSLAGSWSCTTLDSGFSMAEGLAADSAGNVWIADLGHFLIRKCLPDGTCADFATQVGGNLTDLAVDSLGNVYGVSPWRMVVTRFNSSGAQQAQPYLGVDYTPYLADNNHFLNPRAAVDSNQNLLVVEQGGRLVKLNAQGAFQWAFGGFTPFCNGENYDSLCAPMRAAADASGHIYVADGWACRVQKINSTTGKYMSTLGGECGTGNTQFSQQVSGVAVDAAGNIYVADQGNQRIVIYDAAYQRIGQIGTTGVCSVANDHFCQPGAVALDAAGNIYVADRGNNRVQKFNSQHQWQMTLGSGSGKQFDQFAGVEDVAVDAQGKIYVSDSGNNRIQVFNAGGAYLATIGGSYGTNTSQMDSAQGAAVDSAGNVYAADSDNSRVLKFAPGVPDWQQVNLNGFGDVNNTQWPALVADGQYLYAGTTNAVTGALVYRSNNGSQWTQVSAPGFGNPANNRVLLWGRMKGYFYATTANANGFEIWRCNICDGSDWAATETGGLGASGNITGERMIAFNDMLYLFAGAPDGAGIGVRAWRSPSGDTGTWTRVNKDGFGNSGNIIADPVVVYNNQLYVGSGNWGKVPAKIWRCSVCDGSDWVRLVGINPIPTPIPNPPPSLNNTGVKLVVFKDRLYAQTINYVTGTELWRCTVCDDTDWVKVVGDAFGDSRNWGGNFIAQYGDSLYLSTRNAQTTMQVWKSKDGVHWESVSADGLGNSNNISTAGVLFRGDLYLNVRNDASGIAIWKYLFKPFVHIPIVNR